ncbi:MAG: 4Fe-4S binding protein [Chloroflexi bacterium]|nr:4Fe-4S binding protein [Chloroflexota bacterium]
MKKMNPASVRKLPRLDERRCKANGTCIAACPKDALGMRRFAFLFVRHEHADLLHPERCTACGKCVLVCPTNAWSLEE